VASAEKTLATTLITVPYQICPYFARVASSSWSQRSPHDLLDLEGSPLCYPFKAPANPGQGFFNPEVFTAKVMLGGQAKDPAVQRMLERLRDLT
jgi:hypothetical protein